MSFTDQDTIVALGTPRGLGALAIVRLSGELVPSIISACFSHAHFDSSSSHRAYFGNWRRSSDLQAVDEVVLIYFAKGRGFTKEPSADIICHGGLKVSELIIETILQVGARLARPGEFTYRAVMAGHLDLPRAEAVLELIHSNSARAANLALKHLKGVLSSEVQKIESEVVHILANLEASIDFTTEDIQPIDYDELILKAESTAQSLSSLFLNYRSSRRAFDAFRVLLLGPPNAGKSSLMNILVGWDRSIVTPIAGTTRDLVSEEVELDGHLVKFVDSAGLRDTSDVIEAEGVQRTLDEARTADLILFVIDGSGSQDWPLPACARALDLENALVVINKRDLIPEKRDETILAEWNSQIIHKFSMLLQSALCAANSTDGVAQVRKRIIERLGLWQNGFDGIGAMTARQSECLQKARKHLSEGIRGLRENKSPDIVSLSFREALQEIQELLGKNPGDDILDRVFKEFCIGK